MSDRPGEAAGADGTGHDAEVDGGEADGGEVDGGEVDGGEVDGVEVDGVEVDGVETDGGEVEDGGADDGEVDDSVGAPGEPEPGVPPFDPEADHPYPTDRLASVLAAVDDDEEITAYLQAQNVNPVARKRYNDHGEKHIEIVRNRSLTLYDLLKRGGVAFNGASQQGLEEADEPVIVALAAVLHDIGHVVHRDEHPYYSIPLAADVLDRFLREFYDTPAVVRMKGEILHAILCHHTEEEPLTLEAGVLRVADALDMERGRSRIPYERGGRGINTVSSQAIERVTLKEGDDQPVLVEIEMTNAAGVYQVDNLLKAKLADSGLVDLVRIVAINSREDADQIVERIEL